MCVFSLADDSIWDIWADFSVKCYRRKGKNAPSNPYPHYLVRLATSRLLALGAKCGQSWCFQAEWIWYMWKAKQKSRSAGWEKKLKTEKWEQNAYFHTWLQTLEWLWSSRVGSRKCPQKPRCFAPPSGLKLQGHAKSFFWWVLRGTPSLTLLKLALYVCFLEDRNLLK